MDYLLNEQLQLALDYVSSTNQHIFLTGKAGTGKTTFLQQLKKQLPKRIVITAPTGVAAINAGGVTLHSLFQLSFAPFIPSTVKKGNSNLPQEVYVKKFSKKKIALIKSIDLLVIDEISMVRSDVLDAVDEVLRKYRNRYKVFGGVQLLMIGDLHQLSPVVKEDEWKLLKNFYDSVYFFDSYAIKNNPPVQVELKEIFRQKDNEFISLLNNIRENKLNPALLETINSRFVSDFKSKKNERYIHLTTHNAQAQEINRKKLNELKIDSVFYKAEITGDYPETDYPNDFSLELKVGAQVMFIRNDTFVERRFYNGKIGVVTALFEHTIKVQCPDESNEIEVEPIEWERVQYQLNEENNEITENVVGVFRQIPLKTAWAITIHKSQGQTFDKVKIDANAAFAFGQVYVALSRCRSFEGIVLTSKISLSGVKTDQQILYYDEESKEHEGNQEKLWVAKKSFQQDLILELFDFSGISARFLRLKDKIGEHASIVESSVINEFEQKHGWLENEIMQVARKFKLQLTAYFNQSELPENNDVLQDRIRKACHYFLEKTTSGFSVFVDEFFAETDNKAVNKEINELAEKLKKEMFIKVQCLTSSKNGIDTYGYLKAKSSADVNFESPKKPRKSAKTSIAESEDNKGLYEELKQWRNGIAEENNLPVYMVLPQKTLKELIKKCPSNYEELRAIKGIGEAKINSFGDEILYIINEYCQINNIVRTPEIKQKNSKKKKEKTDTKFISYEMYLSGKNINDIAVERGLTIATIENHLAYYVGQGMLTVTDFVSEKFANKIIAFMAEQPKISLSELKESFGEEVSYRDLKFILQHQRFLQAQ
jgi:GTPase SAR1 family protein